MRGNGKTLAKLAAVIGSGKRRLCIHEVGRPLPAKGYDFNGKLVYLSGKMTGIPQWNRDAFREHKEKLLSLGAGYVYDPSCEAPLTSADPHGHAWWMRRSVAELSDDTSDGTGKPVYDAIALIPGWEDSPGSRVEVIVADAIGIDVVAL